MSAVARIRPLTCLFLTQVGVLFSSIGDAQQVENCGIEDYACLSRGYEQDCRTPSHSTRETCAAFLTRVEQHPFASKPAWRLIAATTYRTLSDVAESPKANSEFRARSSALFSGVVSENPTGPYASEAYLGLAAIAASRTENMEFLRQAVAADPSNVPAAESLAYMVASEGSKSALLEAAGLMRSAYLAQHDAKKWYLGESAVGLYEAAAELGRAEQFRQSVYVDSGINSLDARLASVHDGDDAQNLLSSVCDVHIVGLFGASACLRAINSIAGSIKGQRDEQQRQALAEAAAIGMTLVVNAPQIGPPEKGTFQTTCEMFISAGIRSAVVYQMYSQLLSDPTEALVALEKAADLAPSNGQIVYELGLAYLERGRWKESIDALERAKPILPSWISGDVLAMQLGRAEAGRASAGR